VSAVSSYRLYQARSAASSVATQRSGANLRPIDGVTAWRGNQLSICSLRLLTGVRSISALFGGRQRLAKWRDCLLTPLYETMLAVATIAARAVHNGFLPHLCALHTRRRRRSARRHAHTAKTPLLPAPLRRYFARCGIRAALFLTSL